MCCNWLKAAAAAVAQEDPGVLLYHIVAGESWEIQEGELGKNSFFMMAEKMPVCCVLSWLRISERVICG